MANTGLATIFLIEALVIGGMFLLYPRIARRGLLFGVYVGEERWDGEEARQIIRSWQTGIAVWTVVCIVMGLAVFPVYEKPAATALAPLALLAGCVVLFLRAYFRARTMAVAGPPPAVAVLEEPEPPSMWPLLVIAIGILCGVIALSHAAMHYQDLPARVPTHFGPSGRPDAWRPKSFRTVMLLPLLTLVMGIGMGVMVFLVSRAKRAMRFPQTQISIDAQKRFRLAITRFLGCVSIVVVVMLAVMSVGSIRVGLGLSTGLPPIGMALALVLVALALGGTLYIAIRYGQGGARLERAAGNAPLVDGLADNRHWVLGSFYVNRDDPSIFVEHRFGFGYTINLGNWKAVAFLIAFLGTILFLALWGALKS